MKSNVSIDNLNTDENTILDSKGDLHTFDSLILATGSRPFVPDDAQLHLPGRFTMRKRMMQID